MAIYIGTNKVNMSGIDKVYVGSKLVYQKVQPGQWHTVWDGNFACGSNPKPPSYISILGYTNYSLKNCSNTTQAVTLQNVRTRVSGNGIDPVEFDDLSEARTVSKSVTSNGITATKTATITTTGMTGSGNVVVHNFNSENSQGLPSESFEIVGDPDLKITLIEQFY